MEYAAVLGPDDVLSDRPFTDAANTMREVDVMRHMLLHERERALEWVGTAVGFFGSPRDDVDHGVLFALEDELIERMGNYGEAGLLSYYDVELVKGEYGNLILFATPDVPPEWHRDEVHRRAVSVSPGHYHHVRLHKGSISGKLHDGGDIRVERTKYFDFDTGNGTWFALREFS